MHAMRALAACASSSGGVEFDGSAFRVRNNDGADSWRTVRGLTRVLAAAMPIAAHDMAWCRCARVAAQQRRLGITQPSPASNRHRRRLAGAGAPVARQRCKGGPSELAHGTAVDREVTALAGGARVPAPDACTLTLLALLDERRWTVLGAQVPVYSRRLNFATAIDLLCTDCDTRRRVIVLEIKATRLDGSHHCYQSAPPPNDDNDAPRYYSAAAVHEMQLYYACRALVDDCRVHVDEAYVVRVCRSRAWLYALDWQRCETTAPDAAFLERTTA